MLFGHHNDDAQQTTGTPAVTMGVGDTPGLNPLAIDPATGVSLPADPPLPPAEFASPPVLNQPSAPAMPPVPEPAAPPATPLIPPIADSATDTAASDDLEVSSETEIETKAPSIASTASAVSEPDSPQESHEPVLPLADADTATDTPTDVAPVDAVDDVVADDDTSADGIVAINKPTDESPEEEAIVPDNVPVDDISALIGDPTELLSIKQQALSELDPLVDKLDQTPEEKFRTTMMLIQSTDNPNRIPIAYQAAQAITDEKVRAQALLDVVNEINYFTHRPQ